MLEENHKNGLQFENLESGAILGLQQGLSKLQANPEALRAYNLNAAGY